MLGKIRYINSGRQFAKRVIQDVESQQLQKRAVNMIFCCGEEQPFEIEKRNAENKFLAETEILSTENETQTKPRLKFVCGDDDLAENVKANCCQRQRLKLRPVKE